VGRGVWLRHGRSATAAVVRRFSSFGIQSGQPLGLLPGQRVRTHLAAGGPFPDLSGAGAADAARRVAYCGSVRRPLHNDTISDIWLVLTQRQCLDNERFYAKIQHMAGKPREAKPRGRPRWESDVRGSTRGDRESWDCKKDLEPGPFNRL
jgi:hypothetical protein